MHIKSNNLEPLTKNRKQGCQKARWSDNITFSHNKMYHRVAYNSMKWNKLRETFALEGIKFQYLVHI